MFKRRKTDEPPILAAPRAAPLLDALPADKDTDAEDKPAEQFPGEPTAAAPEPAARPDSPNAPAETDRSDAELGVPPYRAPSYRPDVPKEPTPMARPPFPNSPSQSPSSPPMGQPQGQPMGMMSNTRPVSLTVAAPPTPAPAPEAAARRTLVVGRGISLQGTVTDAERLVVDGTVEASMIRATELSVSQGGVFKGEIEVEDAEVAGTIDGTVTARGSLIVRTTGKVLGIAHCRRLQVEDGGQITGRIEMITETAPAPKMVEAH